MVVQACHDGGVITSPVGRPEHAATNVLLNELLAERGFLVMAHRGTPLGSMPPNSVGSVLGAVASGADIVEIDVTCSVDGVAYAFHDGLEPEFCAMSDNLRTLTSAEIDQVSYRWLDWPQRKASIPRLRDVLAAVPPRTLVNVDRSWPWWPAVLGELDGLDMASRLILKCRAWEDGVATLAAHPVKYPFMPICGCVADVDAVLTRDDLNVVGVELLAREASHPFVDPGYLADLHARGVFVMVNAETLNTGIPLFAGFDDETSILRGVDAGWGHLLELGVDVIQTDWPHLVAGLRR